MVMVEDGAHGCDQCTFIWEIFGTCRQKEKSPVQLIQKGFAYDALISMANVHKISNSKYEKGYAVSYSVLLRIKSSHQILEKTIVFSTKNLHHILSHDQKMTHSESL